jgi:hypothetical protein
MDINSSVSLNGDDPNRINNNHSRKSSPVIESDYDNTTVIEDPEK